MCAVFGAFGAGQEMGTFSQRMGIEQPRTVLQFKAMDERLRTALWNAVLTVYFGIDVSDILNLNLLLEMSIERRYLLKQMWTEHFGGAIDDLPLGWDSIRQMIRQSFFKQPWNRVYDLVEALPPWYMEIAPNYHLTVNTRFVEEVNRVLEQNGSGYRFVGSRIAPIITEGEIAAVEQAMDVPESLSPVSVHITTALDRLSDRENPDYRNSIKESISAVESLCCLITGDNNATLGAALKQIAKDSKVELHGALRGAFEQLYGYTSDSDGIRHKLLDESNLSAEDAIFMLVTCSAFVNYLVQKATKAGIQL